MAVGKSPRRKDAVAKVTGRARYTDDLSMPGMLYASVKTNPHLGGAMNGFDDSRTKNMPGVKQVVPLVNGVAVVVTETGAPDDTRTSDAGADLYIGTRSAGGRSWNGKRR